MHILNRMALAPLFLNLGCALGVVLSTPPAQAQKQAVKAGEGPERLNPPKDWTRTEDYAQFQALRKGERLTDKKAEAVLDRAAQWYAYRLTLPEYHDPKPGSRTIYDLRVDAQQQILDHKDPRNPLNAQQVGFVDEFDKRLAARLHEVVKNPKVLVRVNAAMLLARLAASGFEDVADVLIEILGDQQENYGVKLYALRGLKDFFASGRGDSPFKNKEVEAKCISSLLEFLQLDPKLPMNPTQQEVAAVHYVRREAIEALGFTRFPARSEVVRKKVITDRTTALALLRVLRKDKEHFKLEPDLACQIAAAIALCQLQYKLSEDYQADYAVHHIGQFLVEFLSRYNAEAIQKREPWKGHAAHLDKALGDLKENLAGPPAHSASAYVNSMAGTAAPALNDVVAGRATVDPTKLGTWLDQNPPKTKSVYKSLEDSVVKPAEKAAE